MRVAGVGWREAMLMRLDVAIALADPDPPVRQAQGRPASPRPEAQRRRADGLTAVPITSLSALAALIGRQQAAAKAAMKSKENP
jgi:hypothetical protein